MDNHAEDGGARLVGRKVLLTGGAGFIGSHVAEALLRQGVELFIIDNLDDFYSVEIKRRNLDQVEQAGNFKFAAVNICEFASFRDALGQFTPDVVVHLAARAGVRPSIDRPGLYEQVNVGGTLNILELARLAGTGTVIYGSSSSVYGSTNRVPFTEDDVTLRPISPYAATKLAGELMCFTYAHLYHIKVTCLRFFTVYGPRQRPDLAIHKFTALMEAGKSIPVFGDGSMGRDYTYVDDIVAGVVASMDYPGPQDEVPFDVFNLGNSHPVKLSELIEQMEIATGRSAIRRQEPPQAGDVPLTWANIEKSSRLLGYRPRTSLADGLGKFVAWYRKDRQAGASASP